MDAGEESLVRATGRAQATGIEVRESESCSEYVDGELEGLETLRALAIAARC